MKRLALAVAGALGLSANSVATCAASSVFKHTLLTNYQVDAGTKDINHAGNKERENRVDLLIKEAGIRTNPRATWSALLGKFKFGGAIMSAKIKAMKKAAAAWAHRAHARRYALVMATPAPACG